MVWFISGALTRHLEYKKNSEVAPSCISPLRNKYLIAAIWLSIYIIFKSCKRRDHDQRTRASYPVPPQLSYALCAFFSPRLVLNGKFGGYITTASGYTQKGSVEMNIWEGDAPSCTCHNTRWVGRGLPGHLHRSYGSYCFRHRFTCPVSMGLDDRLSKLDNAMIILVQLISSSHSKFFYFKYLTGWFSFD